MLVRLSSYAIRTGVTKLYSVLFGFFTETTQHKTESLCKNGRDSEEIFTASISNFQNSTKAGNF